MAVRERLAWDDHQETVGHDKDLHGVECLVRWQDTTVGDEMPDELDVEDGTPP